MLTVRVGTTRLDLRPGKYEIGRGRSCAVYLDEVRVSRVHATIRVTDAGEVTIEDHDSRNGTYLNGVRLPPRTPTPLSAGDSVAIGAHLLQIEDRQDSQVITEPSVVKAEAIVSAELGAPAAAASRAPARSEQGLRTCPACHATCDREASSCPTCGLDLRALDDENLGQQTTIRVRSNEKEADPFELRQQGVVILSNDVAFLRALRPAFSVSELALGAGATSEEALATLSGRPRLILVDERLGNLDLAALGKNPRLERVPVGLFGDLEDAAGQKRARELGGSFYLRRPQSAILFVARVRFAISRLDRTASGGKGAG